jgi:hypothetical protein
MGVEERDGREERRDLLRGGRRAAGAGGRGRLAHQSA